VLTIPIQALAVRTQKDLEEAARQSGQDSVTLAAERQAADPSSSTSSVTSSIASPATKNPDVQGIFVIRNRKAEFVPVATGIVGVTDIEVLGGVQEGDTIITGSYKTLRTLKPDARVKIDNSVPKAANENEN